MVAKGKTGTQFVHLRTHSAYSLQEGAVSVAKLIDLAIDDKQPALAITDTANLFGALEFSEKAPGKGLQPIIGCTFETVFEIGDANSADRGRNGKQGLRSSPSIVLLCASEVGYRNLLWLVSLAYTRTGDGERLELREADFAGRTDGLICLTGGPSGPLDRLLSENHADEARQVFAKLQSLFGDGLYVELQRTRRSDRAVEEQLLDLAYANDVPLVATNDVFFASEDDYEAHDALLCIKDGRYIVEDDRRRETKDNCFLSQAQMAERFSDLPEALANTLEIARRCHFRPRTHDPILPRFTAIEKGGAAQVEISDEDGLAQEAAELVRQARAGLNERLEQHDLAPGVDRETYDKRLNYELGIIEKMQFPGYFLIVADFIKWAKNEANAFAPHAGALAIVQRAARFTADENVAAIRSLQQAGGVQKRAFARSGRRHEPDHFTRLQVEVGPAQHFQFATSRFVVALNAAQLECGATHIEAPPQDRGTPRAKPGKWWPRRTGSKP
jgi:DNA polymerase-3 subunit alpha